MGFKTNATMLTGTNATMVNGTNRGTEEACKGVGTLKGQLRGAGAGGG